LSANPETEAAATSTKAGNALEVVKAHMAAEDRQDLDATLATFTDDCYYQVRGLGIELRGKAEIRKWYEDLFTAIPDFRNSDEQYWEAKAGETKAGEAKAGQTDEQVFFSAYMEGTHLGTWHGWAPTGRSFRSAMLVRIPIAADGLMEAEIVYNDSADVFMQLGILPRQGSSQERAMQALHRLRTRVPFLR
jgi:steroid delta-isomerase-like uncharacterized protein